MPNFSYRLQLLLDDARRQRLEDESERTGAPVSELIRRAIDASFADLDAVAAGESSAPSWDEPAVPVDVRELVVAEAKRTGQDVDDVLRRAVIEGLGRVRPRPGILDAEPFAERVDDLLDGFGQR